MFGEFTVSDGNPNFLRWSAYLGLGGYGLFPSRPQDRWGIAAFHTGFSKYLKDGLDIDDERGVELFYNWAVTDWMRLTTDLQFIDPGNSDETGIFAGVGTNIRF